MAFSWLSKGICTEHCIPNKLICLSCCKSSTCSVGWIKQSATLLLVTQISFTLLYLMKPTLYLFPNFPYLFLVLHNFEKSTGNVIVCDIWCLISKHRTKYLTGGPEGPGGPLLSWEQVHAWGRAGQSRSTLYKKSTGKIFQNNFLFFKLPIYLYLLKVNHQYACNSPKSLI